MRIGKLKEVRGQAAEGKTLAPDRKPPPPVLEAARKAWGTRTFVALSSDTGAAKTAACLSQAPPAHFPERGRSPGPGETDRALIGGKSSGKAVVNFLKQFVPLVQRIVGGIDRP